MAKILTDISLALFLAYARDAGNWSGQPLVGGNVGGSKEDRGNLTQLKRAGYITTCTDEGCTWLSFTDLGKALAREHGIELDAERAAQMADDAAMHASESRAENAWLTHAESGDFYDDPRGN